MAIDLNWKYIVAIVLQAGVIVYFVMQARKNKAAKAKSPVADKYLDLRNLAISITHQQLKLEIPSTHILVYGIVMDWDMGEDIVTLCAYINGAANMYFRSGDAIIGGGKNKLVGEAAVDFVIMARDLIDRAIPTNTTDLPSPGCVRFHFLTNQKIYAAQENINFITNGTSPWIKLFESGNLVMTAMRDMRNSGENK